jgi:gluconate 2-dehydrogenase gamma chain
MSDRATPTTYFDAHQRATIEAAMARIIPTDHEPGATEAGAVDFLDRYLSGIDFIYAKPDGTGFEELEGKRATAWQQRIEILRATYDAGIEDLDERARTKFQAEFTALTGDQQDDLLQDIERGVESGGAEMRPDLAYGGPVEPALQQTNAEVDLAFFPLLVMHTRQGFYADPIYGGNRDHAGWKVIGFPGPESLIEVHTGRYSSLAWFADNREHPGEGLSS